MGDSLRFKEDFEYIDLEKLIEEIDAILDRMVEKGII